MSTSQTPVATAVEVVHLAREGHFDAVVSRLAPQLQSLTTPEALQAAWDAEIARQGAVTSIGEPVTEPKQSGVVMVKVPVTCERGGLTVVMPVAETGVLAGLQLAPAAAAAPTPPWVPPPYADPATFTERETTLGTGTLAVGGTVSMPTAPGPHPALVLLGGSGPGDRDGTIGPNKPLKDLAWGLATRGVAVARFDKVTHAHGAEVGRMSIFTLTDEYVPDALAAIEELRGDGGVDPGRIFIGGHSQGGTAAPRVAAAAPLVAGLVILAGGATPLHRTMIRQVRYLASFDPATAAATEPALEALERQADLIDSNRLSPTTPAADLPLGTPAPYWLDLRDYDPAAVAASLDRPILLVQGGRDYQATVEDDLARWQAGLAGQPRVTVRIYPDDNHLFFVGSGPSAPAEYDVPQHVDPQVVADVAGWIATTAGGPGGVGGVGRP
jgi:dienelactone hydrolase